MSFVQTDDTLEAAAQAVGITLAELPLVLADPTHRHHADLVAELVTRSAGELEAR